MTEIALRHGFWELRRFSDYYHRVFGELPSQTLRRQPGNMGREAVRLPFAPRYWPSLAQRRA